MKIKTILFFPLIVIFCGFLHPTKVETHNPLDSLLYPQEKHLKNLRQLTFGADNAEAYWSFDSNMVSFQSNNQAWGNQCDQIFYMKVDGQDLRKGSVPQKISTGLGRTTCSFFLPGNKQILYASTHKGGKDCPPDAERNPGGKYLWPIYSTYDIFVADLKGNIVKQLTETVASAS